MIKTVLTREDALALLEVGRKFHSESQFKDEPYNAEGCWALLDATLRHPDSFFIAYDDEYRGLLILQAGVKFFSGTRWVADQVFYVAPEFRGSSLALRLLKEGEKWTRSIGAPELVIMHNAGIGMAEADRFYKRLGFDLTGKIFTKQLLD